MEQSFGTRLRLHREQQQIRLADIADQTKIKVSLLDALERWAGAVAALDAADEAVPAPEGLSPLRVPVMVRITAVEAAGEAGAWSAHVAGGRNGRIEEIRFEGSGCAISTSSASLMTEALKGKTVAEAEQLLKRFLELVTKDQPLTEELGKLAVFSGVREFPARVKCATLAWHTMKAALLFDHATSTENSAF